jgi:hypothetical protein
VQKQLTPREQRRILRETQERMKNKEHKVDLLGERAKRQTGKARYTTKYIIENVVHSTLQIERK